MAKFYVKYENFAILYKDLFELCSDINATIEVEYCTKDDIVIQHKTHSLYLIVTINNLSKFIKSHQYPINTDRMHENKLSMLITDYLQKDYFKNSQHIYPAFIIDTLRNLSKLKYKSYIEKNNKEEMESKIVNAILKQLDQKLLGRG